MNNPRYTHSLRRTPTNSYCVSPQPPTSSRKPETAETGETPNGPSKLYTEQVTLNPADASELLHPGEEYSARQTWAVPARANACASRPRAPLRWP